MHLKKQTITINGYDMKINGHYRTIYSNLPKSLGIRRNRSGKFHISPRQFVDAKKLHFKLGHAGNSHFNMVVFRAKTKLGHAYLCEHLTRRILKLDKNTKEFSIWYKPIQE